MNMFGAGLTTSGLVGVDVRIRKKDLGAARILKHGLRRTCMLCQRHHGHANVAKRLTKGLLFAGLAALTSANAK